MERISLAQLTSALTLTEQPSQKLLNASDGQTLTALILQMAERYPSQDLTDSLEGYLWDFQQLTLRYSLPKVMAGLAELRIRPGQNFFPRPDEVAEEIERQQHERNRAADIERQKRDRKADTDFKWGILAERLAEQGEVMLNGIVYRSLEEINATDTFLRGTMPA